jgi:hypothetical protein
VTGAADRLAIGTICGPDNEPWAFAATQPTHSLQSGGFVGMPWLEFLRMVVKLEEVRGALLQGTTSWIGLDKERIAYVLTQGAA